MRVSFLVSFFLFLTAFESVSMRSLKDVSQTTLKRPEKGFLLFMVFQKDCSACHKQVKKFSCLDLPKYLVGAFSTESDLRKEYFKLQSNAPGFYGDQEVLKKLGITARLTPQILLASKDKSFLFQGLTDCKDIQAKILQEGTNHG